MRNGNRLGRTVTVFGQNQVRLSPAWIVPIERVGPVQQDHDVAILHGCLRHHTLYNEHTAWAHRMPAVA